MRWWPLAAVLLGACAAEPTARIELPDTGLPLRPRPIAAEACNGTDDDSDGRVDEGGGSTCLLAHARAGCRGGVCTVATCDRGFADCDRSASNGCEIDVSTDEANCGACGASCSAPQTCAGGTCAFAPTHLSVTDAYACVVRSNGVGECWGLDFRGRLGSGGTATDGTPNVVSGGHSFTAISTGAVTACGLRTDGTLACWGDGAMGQLGDGRSGPSVMSSVPVVISGLSGVTAVAVGYQHACAVASGGVQCWGSGSDGQNGERFMRTRPGSVPGLVDVTAIGAGEAHTCALHGDGHVSCWGNSSLGRLGAAGTGGPTPVMVSGITNAVSLSVGGLHACVRLADGSARCWGDGRFGQLGDGSTAFSITPVRVAIPIVDSICAGRMPGGSGDVRDYISCVRVGGEVRCFGNLRYGAMGDGSGSTSILDGNRLVATPVAGLEDATAISCGASFACAIRAVGAVACWGLGPQGMGGTTNSFYTAGAVAEFP